MNILDIFIGYNITFLDKKERVLFENNNYIHLFRKYMLMVYLCKNYDIHNIDTVKVIKNKKNVFVFIKIYHIIPLNKKNTFWNYVKYKFKKLLK